MTAPTEASPHGFRLYNTLSRTVEDFEPLEPGHVGLYVCGMTVYDDIHVGHARAMLTFDSFVRYLRHRGWRVTFVRNFTDVDDKIIRRAADLGEEPLALAQRYIDHFVRDAEGMNLLPPTHEPRVSTSIEDITGLISALVERGHAYASEGSVWFSVESDPGYGRLSGQKVDQLRSEDADDGKRHPADFALWKAAKPGEPTWDSPWGHGRPGWHIECSAMAQRWLGPTIDIHGGGLDLVFPHHENEVAQSERGTGQRFARIWMHNGLLTMSSGQKMGKSLGNVVNIADVLADYPAETLRLYYLQNHYRSPLPWNEEALPEALGMLARLYEAREVAERMGGSEDADAVAQQLGADALKVLELGRGLPDALYAALDDDFNTGKALGYAFELARAVNRFSNHKKATKRGGPVVQPALEALGRLSAALGLLELTTAQFTDEVKSKRLPSLGLTPERVEELLAERRQARTDKDWARADAIRDELEGKGIAVMDRGDGTDWRVRL